MICHTWSYTFTDVKVMWYLPASHLPRGTVAVHLSTFNCTKIINLDNEINLHQYSKHIIGDTSFKILHIHKMSAMTYDLIRKLGTKLILASLCKKHRLQIFQKMILRMFFVIQDQRGEKKYYENYTKSLFVYIFTCDSNYLSEHSSSLWNGSFNFNL